MLKERFQEIFEFAKSESPYRKANKGWINQDIFLDLSPSSNIPYQKNEAAKVTLLWSPINKLITNLFLIVIIGSIIVFSSVSFTKGRFHFNYLTDNIEKVQENELLNSIDSQVSDSKIVASDNNLDKELLDEDSKIELSKNTLSNVDNTTINNKTSIEEKQSKNIDNTRILINKKPKSNFF